MRAGAEMCDPEAVNHLAQNAPPLLNQLLVDELGVEFSVGADGDLDVTEEAAHSLPRILHADDLTGRAIITKMLEALRNEPRITLKPGTGPPMPL